MTGAPWDEADLTAQLPADMADFFAYQGLTPVHPNCRRVYRRIYLRGRAMLYADEKRLGVYTVDASRQGIRFFSPIQLLPKLRVLLRLSKAKEFQVEVVRCRRLGERCYDCGTVFVLES